MKEDNFTIVHIFNTAEATNVDPGISMFEVR